MVSQEEFYRIRRLPPYIFAEVNHMKAQARAKGVDIIDLGMGNPDIPTPRHVVDRLVEAARNIKKFLVSHDAYAPGALTSPV